MCGAGLVAAVISLCAHAKGLPVLPEGPSAALGEVTRSLATAQSATPPFFHEVYRKAAALSVTDHSEVWQDVFALDKFGGLRPKHSIFSAFAAVPFYAGFGEIGFWIFQQLLFIGLLYATYSLVKQSTGQALPLSTLISTMLLSQSIFYCYSFSYDLHGCALLIGGLSIAMRFPLVGASVMTLSIFVRPSYLLLILPLGLGTARLNKKRRLIRSALGIGIILLLFGLYNCHFWGSPFLTSYSRTPSFQNGEMMLMPHPLGFDWLVFESRWSEKLLSARGLLPYNLSILALPMTLAFLWFKRDRNLWVYFLSAVGYSMYIFSYPMWEVTSYGNRFLLPAIYLYLLCFIPMIGQLERRASLEKHSDASMSFPR